MTEAPMDVEKIAEGLPKSYSDIRKQLGHIVLCYGEPSGCRADDETNEEVCAKKCALLAAYEAGYIRAHLEKTDEV